VVVVALVVAALVVVALAAMALVAVAIGPRAGASVACGPGAGAAAAGASRKDEHGKDNIGRWIHLPLIIIRHYRARSFTILSQTTNQLFLVPQVLIFNRLSDMDEVP